MWNLCNYVFWILSIFVQQRRICHILKKFNCLKDVINNIFTSNDIINSHWRILVHLINKTIAVLYIFYWLAHCGCFTARIVGYWMHQSVTLDAIYAQPKQRQSLLKYSLQEGHDTISCLDMVICYTTWLPLPLHRC